MRAEIMKGFQNISIPFLLSLFFAFNLLTASAFGAVIPATPSIRFVIGIEILTLTSMTAYFVVPMRERVKIQDGFQSWKESLRLPPNPILLPLRCPLEYSNF